MFTTMSSESKPERVEVITGVQRRRRWTPQEKLALVSASQAVPGETEVN